VVWTNRRDNNDDIYGTRVSKGGELLDPSGIEISAAANGQEQPTIAFDGTNYLVVWQDYRNEKMSTDIYAARVSKEGIILDSSGIAISTAVSNQHNQVIAFDGTNYLVVWIDYRNESPDLYGARVSKDGVTLDENGIAIKITKSGHYFPAIAFDGTNYLVVWEDYYNENSDIYGSRVSKDGVVLDKDDIAISTAANNQECPAIAFDGTNYLVVWQDSRNDSITQDDIYGARISKDGIVLDKDGIAISTETDYQYNPDIAFDGTNYLVAWVDDRNNSSDIYGARVSKNRKLLDPTGIEISTAASDQKLPMIAFDGTNYFVAWQDKRNDSDKSELIDYFDIYGVKILKDGTVSDEFIISADSQDEESPAISEFHEGKALIVYTHFDDSQETVTYRIGARFIYTSCKTNEQCDDGNFCTADSCNIETRDCSHTPANENMSCDDNNPYTINDICTSGICSGTEEPNDEDITPADADVILADTDVIPADADILSPDSLQNDTDSDTPKSDKKSSDSGCGCSVVF